jgi:uncharacterized membrane protein YfcA
MIAKTVLFVLGALAMLALVLLAARNAAADRRERRRRLARSFTPPLGVVAGGDAGLGGGDGGAC